MKPSHAKLISQLDQMNAALAEAFDGLDHEDGERDAELKAGG